ncbi:Ff.00g010770.m01.CDS01 [Fusarium sp. VM40]|nr:Ff.00g010770.m01.CDS01 [Fusarium sp. VM40]
MYRSLRCSAIAPPGINPSHLVVTLRRCRSLPFALAHVDHPSALTPLDLAGSHRDGCTYIIEAAARLCPFVFLHFLLSSNQPFKFFHTPAFCPLEQSTVNDSRTPPNSEYTLAIASAILPNSTSYPETPPTQTTNMPVRVPRLPAAKPSEIFCMGAAGVGVLTPLYLVMPGAEERLSNQTNKWAPRWERNLSYFIPPMEKGVQRIEPPVAKMIQRVEDRLPLEKMAKSVDKGIRSGIARFNGENKP